MGSSFAQNALYMFPGGDTREVSTVVNDDGTYGYVYNGANDKVFYTGKDEYGSDQNIYISVKKVQCKKSDEGEGYLIGTVVNKAAEGTSDEEPEMLRFPNDCGLVEGENLIGVLYAREYGEPNFGSESNEFVLLTPKKLNLDRCKVGQHA